MYAAIMIWYGGAELILMKDVADKNCDWLDDAQTPHQCTDQHLAFTQI